MTLKFIGNGSAFNTERGNNCAYYREGDKILFLDFGESIFERVRKYNILNGVKEIYVAITHLHGDHVGSLETFVLYCDMLLGIKVNLVESGESEKDNDLKEYLTIMGAPEKNYNTCDSRLNDAFKNLKSCKYHRVSHTPALKYAYAIILEFVDKTIYYTGDTNDIGFISNVIENIGENDELYTDTCLEDWPGNVHCYIERLVEAVPEEKRKYVYCMHLDCDEVEVKAKEYGFNVTKVEFV